MALSNQTAVSDGTLNLLVLTIDYFSRDEITVLFDDVVDAYPWAWVGTTDKKISFAPAVPAGVTVLVRRKTDLTSKVHVYSLGAAFTSESLDESFEQVLRIAQEVQEGGVLSETFTDFDVHGHQVVGLRPATAPDEAVTLEQLEDSLFTGASGLEEIGNYAALQAYTGVRTSLYVRGYSNVLDGGHGIFRVNAADVTSADNGVTILVDAAGRRWYREFSGPINAKWAGALGVATDDTAALQAAADAAVTSTRKLYIPKGKYGITQLAIPTGLEVMGDGVGGYGSQLLTYVYDSTVLMQLSGTNDDAIVFDCPQETGFYRLFHIHMHDLILLKQGSTDTVGNGLSARQVGLDRSVTANHCLVNGIAIFENMLVRGFPENGMYFKQGAVPMYCNHLDFIFNGGYGLRIDGANYLRNVVLRNIAGDGNKGRAVIYVACATADAEVAIDGVYSEFRNDNPYGNSTGFNGAQPYAVEVGTFGSNSVVKIANATAESIVTDEGPEAAIFVTSGTQAGTPRIIWDGIMTADLTAPSRQKAVLLDNRAWDSFNQYKIPAGVVSGVYSLVDTGNSSCVRYKAGFVSFGDGFQKPAVGSEGTQVYGPLPVYSWYESDAGADAKGWSVGPSSGALLFRAFNDAGSAGDNYLQVLRSGTTVSRIETLRELRATALLKGTSTVSFTGIPTYADNAAAIAGGTVIGDVYKTATGDLRIRV